MNINKTGGGATSSDSILKFHIEKSRDYILKQIEIIKSEVIVSCIGDLLNDYLFSDGNWQQSGYAIWVKKINNIKIISFVHPSSRCYTSAPYCLLKSITESDTFKNL